MGVCDSCTGSDKNKINDKNLKEQTVPLDGIEPIPRNANKIIDNQLEKNICKIYTSSSFGTGFLCKIPFPDEFHLLSVLITTEHVINKDEIIKNKVLKISLNDDTISKNIDLTENRKIYSNKKYDTTIIEIIPSKDKLFDFLELSYEITHDEPIYILQYPKGYKLAVSYGKINDIDDFEIYYNAATLSGSSGSPVLNLSNFKVIGIHKGAILDENNNGTLLKYPILEFISNPESNRIILDTEKENIKKEEIIQKEGTSVEKFIYNKEDSILRALRSSESVDGTGSSDNYIMCVYIYNNKNKEINLIHDYSCDTSEWKGKIKTIYYDSMINKNFLKENIDLYIDGQKVNFNYKYKNPKHKSNFIVAKFVFKKKITSLAFLFYKCINLNEIDLFSFNSTNASDMSYMFSGCYSLVDIIGISSINTINMKNMSYMFRECTCLQWLDLKFNTINVIDMTGMFYECKLLKRLNLVFNTTNVKSMSCVFYGCGSLNSLDLSSFNTTNVKDMNNMFMLCFALESLNVSSFNTENVENMEEMFGSCCSLKSLDLSSFNTENVRIMKGMFDHCHSLESLNLTPFNTENVEEMNFMFNECKSLKSIDLSSFNIINVQSTLSMFKNCESLEFLDLSSFKKNNIVTMLGMFEGCTSLKSLDLSSFKKKYEFIQIDGMFKNCKSLTKKNIKCKYKEIKNELSNEKNN